MSLDHTPQGSTAASRWTVLADPPVPIVDEVFREGRAERYSPLPEPYRTGPMAAAVCALGVVDNFVWSHQKVALEMLATGHDFLTTTATGSGKTMPFIAHAVLGLRDRGESTLIIAPARSLAHQTVASCQRALAAAGISESSARELHSDIKAYDRPGTVATPGIVVATPDMVNKWLLDPNNAPMTQTFLAHLTFVVVDECHAMDSILGSNAALVFRRLDLAQRDAARRLGLSVPPIQYGASSATVGNPLDHLENLTGRRFILIDDRSNGAPRHPVDFVHLDGPGRGPRGEAVMARCCQAFIDFGLPFVVFCDGRQIAERIAAAIGDPGVLPYRAGYQLQDRQTIEQAFRNGTLKGIVATAALELGIDIPRIEVVLNFGVPKSRICLQQRAGRVARHGPGIFAILAPRLAFVKRGTTFREMCRGPAEDAHIHIGNPYIQVQNALCLLEESSRIASGEALPAEIAWPEGFAAMVHQLRSGAILPPELAKIEALARGRAHRMYSMRAIAGRSYRLIERCNPDHTMETLTEEQAFSECYPQAIYRHRTTPYRVHSQNSSQRTIYVDRDTSEGRTVGINRRWVTIPTDQADVLANHHKASASGSLSEMLVKVSARILGYKSNGQAYFYVKDEDASAGPIKPHSRIYRTTAVVIRINHPLYSGPVGLSVRRRLARTFCNFLCQTDRLGDDEIEAAWDRISEPFPSGLRTLDDAIVVFDRFEGGFRLAGGLYRHVGKFIDRLNADNCEVGQALGFDLAQLAALVNWYRSLAFVELQSQPEVALNPNERIILAEGSIVTFKKRDQDVLVRIGPASILGDSDLVYQYEHGSSCSASVLASKVEPFGDKWELVAWNEVTGKIRKLAA